MAPRQQTVAHRATKPQAVDLNRVAAFVQVMEAGSFSAAARQLGQPKSSLSRAVSKLERELGVVLLRRTTRKLAITEAGQLYLERAREALGMLAEASSQLLDADVAPRGRVRMTAPLDASGSTLADALASFTKRYPGIRLECVFTQRRVDLLAEGIDLALRAGALNDASLAGRKVGDTPIGLYASPQYLAARGTPRKLAQLAEHDCILFRGARGSTRWTLEGKHGRESVDVSGPIDVDEMAYAFYMALRDVGIALLPSMLANTALNDGKLVRVLPTYHQPGNALYVVYPATRHLPRRVALLRDHLYETLRPMFE